ncbi:MAG: xanthine dehydrogenase family protein subunit M [Desulfobacterales bacterium]|nr:xanthine dehydrogenase family protein subunit M [Desulfobacterales bacterium]
MIRFEYLEPKTLKKASSLLHQHGKEAMIIAGGTDLLRQLKLRTVRPRFLINIKPILPIDRISNGSGAALKIGAATTIGSIEHSPVVRAKSFALYEAAHALGSPQIRNLATIGGNLCNAAPSAETAPVLLARQAKAHISGIDGSRIIDLESFFLSAGKTILQKGELLSHISIPAAPAGSGEAYIKHGMRSSMDIAVVNVAAFITLTPSGNKARQCFISLGAVAPKPIRAYRAEQIIRGNAPSEKLILEAARLAVEEAQPISDMRASAQYRKDMIAVLTERALKLALERARLSLKH